ncbi:helix-turn-helix domain-containing protein [Colwellia piezophila]|uniref:helix-turn-helix domain-containing protein n=1 Tax=Colwellia piezophila TaxID=211668 RepID=UPI0003635FD1|nr:helix-turn-helix domain-containing protein [Colwellia piezophila]
MTIPRKKYTTKSKLRAAKLVVDDGFTQKDAAKKTGCAISTLKKWIKRLKEERQEIKPNATPMKTEHNKLNYITKVVMKNYRFTLRLSGINIHTPNLEDWLFKAGCGDGVLSSFLRQVDITFIRESPSLESAVLAAINSIESSSLNIKVISIRNVDSIHLSDIAPLSEMVHYFASGARRRNRFPMSVEEVQKMHQLSQLGEGLCSFDEPEKTEIELAVTEALHASMVIITKALNEALKIKNSKPRVKNLLNKLCDSTV